jgi:hypothetical protein
MSVTSATQVKLTATTAEPPKKSTSSQPWQATGLTYYHNEYVNRAADLGCCGVTHLLIFADSSLPVKVGKIALFAIVSLGFAMIDVIRAAWTKITGSRTVAPVTPASVGKPTTTTPAAPTSASTTEVSSKPADAAKPKPAETADETNAEETQEKEPEANPLPQALSYDRKAIEGLTKQVQHGTNILASAIGSLQDVVSQRPSTTELKKDILEVRNNANTFAKNFTEASSSHQAALKKASKEFWPIPENLLSIQRQMEQFLTFAHHCDPSVLKGAAPELFHKEGSVVHPTPLSSKKKKPSQRASASGAPFLASPPPPQLSMEKLDAFYGVSSASSDPKPLAQPVTDEAQKAKNLELKKEAEALRAEMYALAPKAFLTAHFLKQHLDNGIQGTWELEVLRLKIELQTIWDFVFKKQTKILKEICKIDKLQPPIMAAGLSQADCLKLLEQDISNRGAMAIEKRKVEIKDLYTKLPEESPPAWIDDSKPEWTLLEYVENLNLRFETLQEDVAKKKQKS